jgi:hypothetical protein
VALVAVAAVVVGAAVADEAVDGVDVMGAILDKAGVVLAVGADGAGT